MQFDKEPGVHVKKLLAKPEFQKVLSFLEKFSEGDRELLIQKINEYRLNVNQAYESVQLIWELQLKDASFSWQELDDAEVDGGQKALPFMKHLRERCYPQSMRRKQRLDNFLHRLSQPRLRWEYKDNFESDEITLRASFRSDDDVAALIQYLQVHRPVIKDLIDFIQNPE